MIDDENPLVRQSPTLNPYWVSMGFFVSRLLWDLNFQSWRSRRAMRTWKNRYHDAKAVILCNGPSLLKVDFEALQASGVFCLGLNKINLLFDKTSFRPSCVVAVNRLVVEQCAAFYNTTDLPLFLDSHATKRVQARRNVVFLHGSVFPNFARDCSMSLYEGFTVTYVALQLAFHMGFRDVALVGADHVYANKGAANKAVISGERDDSHFDPNYFAGGAQWHLPDLFQSEVSYTMARNMYSAFGGRIVNATAGGELEIFERVSLDKFLALPLR